MKPTLKLFKSLPIEDHSKTLFDVDLIKKTLPYGFVFSPEVMYYYEGHYNALFNVTKEVFGLTAEQINSSFHKSWNKVANASMEQLFIEQILHYFTTYGFEALGVDSNYIYIPKEELNIPNINEDWKVIVIKGITGKEIKDKLMKLLTSGIALSEETINDVIELLDVIKVTPSELEFIKNKEVRVILYDRFKHVPQDPTEFVRYLIYKTTGKTLIIKSKEVIGAIKESQTSQNEISLIFRQYIEQYGYERLAEVFYRMKPIFLAFRSNKQLRPIINKIRRLANTYHKPMKEDYLNSITRLIKNNETIYMKELEAELKKANTFRKIRLAYALQFRINNPVSILYKIRNGKGYATTFEPLYHTGTRGVLAIVLKHIASDISKNVKDKKIYIPEEVNYTLPATEKQFTGYFPSGTNIAVKSDMVFGIHWNNVSGNRIDLDLSVISMSGDKIGWDAYYRSRSRDILFSGDVTDAHNGASELFYVKKQLENPLIMYVNYFNIHDKELSVPLKIIVGKEDTDKLTHNHMLDPNKVLAVSNTSINVKQKALGFVVPDEEGCKFFFSEFQIGNNITSTGKPYTINALNAMYNFYCNAIQLRDILYIAGANLVEDKKDADIDLSPESLEKDTILNLLI